MAKQPPRDTLTIMEAVDNLSSLAELDIPPTAGEEERRIAWSDEAQIENNQQKIKQTFRVLHNYLNHIYQKDREQLNEPQTQRGLQAMMLLAGEAAQKLDKFTSIFKGAHGLHSVTELKEYQDLQKFYLNKIMRRFQEGLESEAAWEAEWMSAPELVDIEKRGLKDLETVRRDREYELFTIKKEDGASYFNRNLLRHIKLLGDFDEVISAPAGEDPLLKFKIIEDRDYHFSAKEILKLSANAMRDFYAKAMQNMQRDLVSSLNKALMALMLAGNSRNLLQNTEGKSCLAYFLDFHHFLREALNSHEYRRLLGMSPDERDSFSRTLISLTHALSIYLFTRTGNRYDAVNYIYRLIKLGGKESKGELEPHEALSMWNTLLDDDECIRNLLKQYPSGPLLKILDIFHEQESYVGFDPIAQENIPQQLFTCEDEKSHITVLRLPTPTNQEYINIAHIDPEFKAFLRYLKNKDQKHLLINFQDRTSWQEHARCKALEELQNDEEFYEHFYVVTLPKQTEFYLQSGSYQDGDDAETFIAQFIDQINSAEECGFYFPPFMRNQEFDQFVKEAMEKIRHTFFFDKTKLSRKNRLDFIEIFYQLFSLKLIDWINPDTFSFTSKDSVDTGIADSAMLFSMLRLMNSGEQFTEAERDHLVWMFFYPALSIRDRTIDLQRFNRAISAIAQVHTELDIKRDEILATFRPLYSRPILGNLKPII